MNYLLVATGLVKTYNNHKAVNNLSLHISAGECLALLGPNGAGKTTTLEMLEGLSLADMGEISILGLTYTKNKREILEKIGVTLQETHLYKKFTVRETMRLFQSFYRETLEIDYLLKRLDLIEKADARLETLSGGQKQKLYLGCALINNPALLFLDEPTTGLDPEARRTVWDIVKQAKNEKRGILLTTHYMEEAEVLADRIAILDRGKIIACGTLAELISKLPDNFKEKDRNLENVYMSMTGRMFAS